MVKLKLIVKSRSKAQETAHELQKAAGFVKDTALYLQQIADFLQETPYVDAANFLPDSLAYPSSVLSAPHETRTSELTAEDVEAALILANMQAGKIYTSAELEAAATLNMMQQGSSAGIAAVQGKSGSESQENIPAVSRTGKRVLRSGTTRVTEMVSLVRLPIRSMAFFE